MIALIIRKPLKWWTHLGGNADLDKVSKFRWSDFTGLVDDEKEEPSESGFSRLLIDEWKVNEPRNKRLFSQLFNTRIYLTTLHHY